MPGVAARRVVGWVVNAWRRPRRRVGWLDHLIRAGVRYDQADGGRLAAAVTYYAFFATFALGLLGVAIFGFVLDDPRGAAVGQRYAAKDVPSLDVQALRDVRGTIGVMAFVGLPITGWSWVDALRSSIRRIWRLSEYPGNVVVRVLMDLLVLVGTGIAAGLFAGGGVRDHGGGERIGRCGEHRSHSASRWLLSGVGLLVGLGVNTVLACGALTGLGRVRMPWRRLLGPAVLVALSLELLKTLGRLYVQHTEANPTYQIVAGSVSQLYVFLNAINQLVLFAAALTATSTAGRPSDLTEDDDSPELRLPPAVH